MLLLLLLLLLLFSFAAHFLSCVRAQFLFNNLFSKKDFFKREGIKKINSWNFYLFSDLQPKLSESSSGALPLHIPHKTGEKKPLVAAFCLLGKFCQNAKFGSEVFFLRFSVAKKCKKKVKICPIHIYLVFIVQSKYKER